jgi:hypothetical protein
VPQVDLGRAAEARREHPDGREVGAVWNRGEGHCCFQHSAAWDRSQSWVQSLYDLRVVGSILPLRLSSSR